MTEREALAQALEALERVKAEKAPGYHDCIDNGEPECAWCAVSDAIPAVRHALTTPAPVAAGEGMVMVPRERLQFASDLLAERTYGNPARSSGHNARVVIDHLLSAAPAQSPVSEGAEIERLREALREMIYETTSMCQMEDDGSHKPIIRAGVLARARAALTSGDEHAGS